jgi:hypothetical protein
MAKNENENSRIRRGRKQNRFTTIDNEPIENRALSWKAKGLLTYLMSKPEDWEVKLWQLKEASKDGRDSTDAGLKELITRGYIRRTRLQDERGRFAGYLYEVSDIAFFDTGTEQEILQNNATINGKAVNGKTVNGKTVNGKTVNGKTVNGKTATNKNIYSKKELEQDGEVQNIDLKSVCVDENTHTPNQNLLFAESPYSDFEIFKNFLTAQNFAHVDAQYYFSKISRSCASKGTKSKDFGAYILMWIEEDKNNGKLRLAQAQKTHQKQEARGGASEVGKRLENLKHALQSKNVNKTEAVLNGMLETLLSCAKDPNLTGEEAQEIASLQDFVHSLLPPQAA